MSVVFDAATENVAAADPQAFNHTPVGTPRGVWVILGHLGDTDIISGVTYGGDAMSRVDSIADLSAPGARGYLYFLGTSIPTGTQSVSIDRTESSTSVFACVVTVTANADTEVVDFGSVAGEPTNVENPSVALSYAGRECLGIIGGFHGRGATSQLVDFAGQTRRHDHDFGTDIAVCSTQTTATTSDSTLGYTVVSDQSALVAAAIAEVAAGGDATGSGSPTKALSKSASGVAVQKFTGSGTPTEALGASATGAATNTESDGSATGSGTPTAALDGSGSGSGTNDPPASTVIGPGDDWQAKVDAHPSGTVFTVLAGIHRFASCAPKANMQFIGEGDREAILTGAKELDPDDFTSDGAGHWFITGQTQQNTDIPGTFDCQVGHGGCYLPEQLWVDGTLYERMPTLAEATAGKWFFDYAADRIYLGTNPSGATLIETSVTAEAINSGNDGVVVRNLVVEKYANGLQRAAVGGSGSSAGSWEVDDVEVRHCHGQGIRVGHNSWVHHCYTHHMGQVGISCSGVNILIEDNETAYNNTAWNGPGSSGSSGGMKLTSTTDLIVRRNYIHDNMTTGLWFDIDNFNVLAYENIIEDNDWRGIYYEISQDGVLRDNLIQRNGYNPVPGTATVRSPGILISNSVNVEVYNNEVIDNAAGICCVDDDRGIHDPPYDVVGCHIHDNFVVQPEIESDSVAGGLSGNDSDFTTASVLYENNHYIIASTLTEPFRWAGNERSQSYWQGTALQDINSTFGGFVGSGSPTKALGKSASGVAVQKFSGSGTPTKGLGKSASGAATQQFTGSGTPTKALGKSAAGAAVQADVIASGAPTATLVASATGSSGDAEDSFTAFGAPSEFLSASAAGVASQQFNGSGTPTTSLTASCVGVAEQQSYDGPTVAAVRPPIGSTGAREIIWPGSTADPELSDLEDGDVGILFVGTKNQAVGTFTDGPNDIEGDSAVWSLIPGIGANAAGTAGDAAAVKLIAYWAPVTSHHMRSFIIPDVGAVVFASLVVVRGCRTDDVPWDVVAAEVTDPASTDITLPGLTTTLDDCLILSAALHAIDQTEAASNSMANTTVQTLTTVEDRSSATGPGGIGMLIVTSEKVGAGVVDDTTGTWDASTRSAAITLALRPAALPPAPVEGSGAPTETLVASVTATATNTIPPGTGSPTATLDASATGAATQTFVATSTATTSLVASATGTATRSEGGHVRASTPLGLIATLVATAVGVGTSTIDIPEPPPEPPPLVPGDGGGRRKPRRILLPEEEPEQPKIRRKRPATMPPVTEAAPLPELPPAPPAFAPVTFDPMLWASVSAPPVRPQVPVVTQQDTAEEEQFLAQLLDLI